MIVLSMLLWSSQGVVVRLAGVPVHVLIFYSCIVALIVQGITLFLTDYKKDIPRLSLLKYVALLGAIGFLNTFAYFYAFMHTTIANAVLTHYTAPIIVAFVAPFFLQEKITGSIVAALVIASAGLWLMLNGFSLGDRHTLGILAGLTSGFAYAGVIIAARVLTQALKPLVLAFLSNSVVALILLPFVKEFPLNSLWIFVLMGVVHSTIAPLLYYSGLKHVSANRAAILGYLEPVSAIIFSMIFLHEVPGMISIAGGMMILVSGYITLRRSALDAETA